MEQKCFFCELPGLKAIFYSSKARLKGWFLQCGNRWCGGEIGHRSSGSGEYKRCTISHMSCASGTPFHRLVVMEGQNYLRVFIEHSIMAISWSPKATKIEGSWTCNSQPCEVVVVDYKFVNLFWLTHHCIARTSRSRRKRSWHIRRGFKKRWKRTMWGEALRHDL